MALPWLQATVKTKDSTVLIIRIDCKTKLRFSTADILAVRTMSVAQQWLRVFTFQLCERLHVLMV